LRSGGRSCSRWIAPNCKSSFDAGTSLGRRSSQDFANNGVPTSVNS
jgi:hypothetical protein